LAIAFDGIENGARRGPSRRERRRGAATEWEGERGAESVSVKQHATEDDVVFGQSQYLLRISIANDRHVLMQMDDALRPARRAGAVKPEGHVLTMDAGGGQGPGVRREQFGHRTRM